MKSFRFAAVISHPIQHFSPLFRELARRPGIEVKVFYLCDHGLADSYDEGFDTRFSWDVPLTQGYEHEFLRPGFRPRKFGFFEMDAPALSARLAAFAPDLIWLHGYGQRMCWRALRWARRNQSHVVYFGDSELLHTRSRISLTVKKILLPYFFSRCDAFITVGDNNEAYYSHYGVGKEKLVRAACPVEMARFSLEPDKRETCRRDVRQGLGVRPDDILILFSGKLQDYKRPIDLVLALGKVPRKNVHILFIGDGPLRGAIEREAGHQGVDERVHMAGFINQAEIPGMLSAGDIMALPSAKEPFGLVISESLPFGMPVLASDKVGCVGPTATARPGENALVYPVGDIDALADSILSLVDDGALRSRLGAASLQIAPTQDVGVTADAIAQIAARIT